MLEMEVFAGICGFTTVIRVEEKPGYQATCQLKTGCPHFKKVGKILEAEDLNVMNELFKKVESQVLAACQDNVPHVTCPVPAAILKALEVSAGLALPKDATITFRK